MLLTVDVGNTQTAVGLFDGDELMGDWRMTTIVERTADELAVEFVAFLGFIDRALSEVTEFCLASVVPAAGDALSKMIKDYTEAEQLSVGPDVDCGLKIEYQRPETVGADRLANAAEGFALTGGPLTIVDFGTATTFDVISSDGAYLGGVIAPGVITGADALVRQAAGLQGVSLETPKRYIGRDTAAALRAGIILGTAVMVDGIVGGIRRELGTVCAVIGTGGLIDLVGLECRTIDRLEPKLTLYGLKRIWNLNH